jgi:hypothetical protein
LNLAVPPELSALAQGQFVLAVLGLVLLHARIAIEGLIARAVLTSRVAATVVIVAA